MGMRAFILLGSGVVVFVVAGMQQVPLLAIAGIALCLLAFVGGGRAMPVPEAPLVVHHITYPASQPHGLAGARERPQRRGPCPTRRQRRTRAQAAGRRALPHGYHG